MRNWCWIQVILVLPKCWPLMILPLLWVVLPINKTASFAPHPLNVFLSITPNCFFFLFFLVLHYIQVVGTPSYMCPELLADIPYGSKSDIWSLGKLFLSFFFIFYQAHFGLVYKSAWSLICACNANCNSGCCIYEMAAHRPAFKAFVSYWVFVVNSWIWLSVYKKSEMKSHVIFR